MAYTSEQRKEYQKEYRKRRRIQAVELLGGKCVSCGTVDGLEFNHIDPMTKLFAISQFHGSLEVFWEEVQKCNLMCRPCHVEETRKQYNNGILSNPIRFPYKHGTERMYRNTGCRCELCRFAKRASRIKRKN